MRSFIIAVATAAAFGFGAPAALADSTLNISLSNSSPEQGIPITVSFVGTAPGADSDGDAPALYAVARPAGGLGCQATFGDDQEAAGDVGEVLEDGDDLTPGQTYSFQDALDPDPVGDVICAWLESTDSDDPSAPATPDAVIDGPITVSYSSAAPQVGKIGVSVPAKLTAGQGYQIRYATQTDQDESLASVVIPAGGLGCADSYEDDTDSDATGDDVFSGDDDIFGTTTTIGSDEEDTAGPYVICSWVEDPTTDQVYASSATDITIAAAPSGASAGQPASGKSGGSSSSGSARAACVVPKYVGATLATERRRLAAAHCTVGAVHRVESRVRSGEVIKLSRSPGRRLKAGAAVAITVSEG